MNSDLESGLTLFFFKAKESSRLWNFTSQANETFRKTREKTKGMGKNKKYLLAGSKVQDMLKFLWVQVCNSMLFFMCFFLHIFWFGFSFICFLPHYPIFFCPSKSFSFMSIKMLTEQSLIVYIYICKSLAFAGNTAWQYTFLYRDAAIRWTCTLCCLFGSWQDELLVSFLFFFLNS